MKKTFKIVSLVFITFISHFVEAHNPDEINYDVVINDTTQQLVIHFTPIAAIRLMQNLKPSLKKETVIQLDDYLTDFESYFNKTIELKVDNQQVYFKLIKNDLKAHDATLTFALQNIKINSSEFNITVHSFLEVFKRIKNDVSINFNGKQTNCSLNKNNISCSLGNKINVSSIAGDYEHLTSYYISGFIFITAIFLGYYLKRKKIIVGTKIDTK